MIIHLGPLNLANGVQSSYALLRYLKHSPSISQVILKIPRVATSLTEFNPDPADVDWANLIRTVNTPVWASVDLRPSIFATPDAAAASAQAEMDYVAAQFANFKISSLLKGFHLRGFGFKGETYGNGGFMTAQQERDLVAYAHTVYYLPVAVQAEVSPEAFAVVGPQGRSDPGLDQGRPLWNTPLGRNNGIRDMVIAQDPVLYLGQVSPDGIARATALRESYRRNVDVVWSQAVDLSQGTPSPVTGMDFPQEYRDFIRDMTRFITAIGDVADLAYPGMDLGVSGGLLTPELLYTESSFVNTSGSSIVRFLDGAVSVTYEQADGSVITHAWTDDLDYTATVVTPASA